MASLTVDQALTRADACVNDGKLDEARNLYQAVLRAYPDNQPAQQALRGLDTAAQPAAVQNPPQKVINELVNLYNQGQLAAVAEKAGALTQSFPDAFVLWNILGASAAQSGQIELAETAFRRASELNPDYAEAHNNLGNVLKEQGKFDAAIDAYGQALKINPNYIVAHNNIGVTRQSQGKPDAAEAAFRSALAVKPDYAEARNHLGVALQEQSKLSEAVEAYREALRAAPDYADAHNNLGNVLSEQGKFDAAVAAFGQALKIRPDYAKAHNNLGNTLKKQGEFDAAIAAYERALAIQPDYAEALNNLGNGLQEMGKRGEAIDAYDRALKIRPDYADVYRHLGRLKTFEEGDPQIAKMRELYADANLGDEDRCQLCFALAKVQEDLGSLSEALEFYKAGNALKKKMLGYSLSKDEARFSAIKATNAAILENALPATAEPLDHTPIFILGMPRSGTTLVEQIVSAHSEVTGADELPFADNYGSALSTGKKPSTAENIREFRHKYLAEAGALAAGNPYVTDKMPQNFFYIGLICAALPEAKIVHLKRDPAATCWSNFKHFFQSDALGYCCDLDDVAGYYRLYKDLMRFWEDRYPDRIHHLDYERLTTDQEAETRRLIEGLGLDWQDACLHPQKNPRIAKTSSQQQVRRKVYAGSSQKWRAFEPFLNGAFDGLSG